MNKWFCEDGKENVLKILRRKKDAVAYAEKHPKVMEIHKYIHSCKEEEDSEYKGCVWKKEGWDGYKYAPPYIMLREQKLSYSYSWYDENTLSFDIGDGELSDEDGNYFIHIHYRAYDDKWTFQIFWYDDVAKIGFEGSNKYLTEQDMKYLKKLITVKVAVWNLELE